VLITASAAGHADASASSRDSSSLATTARTRMCGRARGLYRLPRESTLWTRAVADHRPAVVKTCRRFAAAYRVRFDRRGPSPFSARDSSPRDSALEGTWRPSGE
jgi:hypothetical protein